MAALREVKGIGEWTVQYVAMRALAWPDAFLPNDVALMKALGVTRPADAVAAVEAHRPWRSYAVLALWARLAAAPVPATPAGAPAVAKRRKRAVTVGAARAFAAPARAPTAPPAPKRRTRAASAGATHASAPAAPASAPAAPMTPKRRLRAASADAARASAPTAPANPGAKQKTVLPHSPRKTGERGVATRSPEGGPMQAHESSRLAAARRAGGRLLRVVFEPRLDDRAPAGGWGTIWLEGDADALAGLYFTDQRYAPRDDAATVVAARSAPRALRLGLDALAAYLAGERGFALPPLAAPGTAFQERVWAALRAIPYGETTTYGAIAAALGRPEASRAVGAAVGRNPVSLLVPCHRVVGGSGALTGFAGGLARKRALLALERDVRLNASSRTASPPARAGADASPSP
jgi:methylated-DNA-[protein]-cysteine S-methyltransferase